MVAIHYVTKWGKSKVTQKDDKHLVAKYLKIRTRYGCPKVLVSDCETRFVNDVIQELTKKYKMKHRLISLYHPRANGSIEKQIEYCKIISKTVQNSISDWNSNLLDEVWAYRTPCKVTTEFTPFQLVYGQKAI